MNRNQIEVARRKRIEAKVAAEYPEDTPEQQAETVEELIEDEIHDENQNRAFERDTFGEPEDTPCLESGRDNCDDWGTGEGRFHGRICA